MDEISTSCLCTHCGRSVLSCELRLSESACISNLPSPLNVNYGEYSFKNDQPLYYNMPLMRPPLPEVGYGDDVLSMVYDDRPLIRVQLCDYSGSEISDSSGSAQENGRRRRPANDEDAPQFSPPDVNMMIAGLRPFVRYSARSQVYGRGGRSFYSQGHDYYNDIPQNENRAANEQNEEPGPSYMYAAPQQEAQVQEYDSQESELSSMYSEYSHSHHSHEYQQDPLVPQVENLPESLVYQQNEQAPQIFYGNNLCPDFAQNEEFPAYESHQQVSNPYVEFPDETNASSQNPPEFEIYPQQEASQVYVENPPESEIYVENLPEPEVYVENSVPIEPNITEACHVPSQSLTEYHVISRDPQTFEVYRRNPQSAQVYVENTTSRNVENPTSQAVAENPQMSQEYLPPQVFQFYPCDDPYTYRVHALHLLPESQVEHVQAPVSVQNFQSVQTQQHTLPQVGHSVQDQVTLSTSTSLVSSCRQRCAPSSSVQRPQRESQGRFCNRARSAMSAMNSRYVPAAAPIIFVPTLVTSAQSVFWNPPSHMYHHASVPFNCVFRQPFWQFIYGVEPHHRWECPFGCHYSYPSFHHNARYEEYTERRSCVVRRRGQFNYSCSNRDDTPRRNRNEAPVRRLTSEFHSPPDADQTLFPDASEEFQPTPGPSHRDVNTFALRPRGRPSYEVGRRQYERQFQEYRDPVLVSEHEIDPDPVTSSADVARTRQPEIGSRRRPRQPRGTRGIRSWSSSTYEFRRTREGRAPRGMCYDKKPSLNMYNLTLIDLIRKQTLDKSLGENNFHNIKSSSTYAMFQKQPYILNLNQNGPLPNVLQEVPVPVINNSVCESMYQAAGYVEHIPNIFICAGWRKGGFDSCEGDSGGPMVIQRPDKRWLLAGIISWGIGCAEPNQPGVYTRISAFRDWINQILQF